MTPFNRPGWVPRLEAGTRLLIAGASGGLGNALVSMLLEGSDGIVIGAHGATKSVETDDPRVLKLIRPFDGAADCTALVDEFAAKAGGIDALVCLSGGIHFSGHWKDMPAELWQKDMEVNLNQPFYLARAAMERMKAQGSGGRILLNGTESALHGGSAMSFPYAIAKRGTECMVQGLAREGAPDGILVNGVRFGYITSGFHQRWHAKTPADMDARAQLVPLKRGGHPDEAAALMIWMLSGWSQFVTGQMFALTGGDWL
ncbi:MAG TPA: SDR family oxidoreductase [Candidatus Omnitrophota bacterium]|nr:SDR family oxidoreductase [Candidatus Omnitrophota bacterium]